MMPIQLKERVGFSDHILGEYYQMSLTSIPRVTGVSGEEEAFTRLKARHYDMIIIMIGVDKESPMLLCKKIKDKYPYLPTFILLNNPGDVSFCEKTEKSLGFLLIIILYGQVNQRCFLQWLNSLKTR